MAESRAMVLTAPAQPMSLQTRAVAEPGPGQVRLAVKATSCNFHDFVGCMGGIPGLPWPRVAFSDCSAEVEAVGDGVTRVKPGDKVSANFFPNWIGGRPDPQLMAVVYGDQIDGFCQSAIVVDERSLVKAPEHLSFEEIATLGCAGLTAWRSLVVEAQVKAGDVVVVQGTGGVSVFAIGFAKMLGAEVILTSSSDEKLEKGKALGADHLINYRSTPQWSKPVMEITGGRGADLVVDVGGAETFPEAVAAARLDGHVSIIGVLSGVTPEFPLVQVMGKNLTVKGITVGNRTQFDDMNRAIALHGYRPVIDRTFPLEGANDALQLMASKTHFGKIVIGTA
jgi:NADPH:quinone reductase-like Zn-dependent oxidoreductase